LSPRVQITHPRIEEYLRRVERRPDPVLRSMEAYAKRHGFPVIGPLVGPLLFALARASRARRVFELGSGFGYSAVWFARAVGPRGLVVMTEGDPGNSRRAMRYLARAGLARRVRPLVGDALTLLAKERGTFDLILNDIDKHQYPEVIPLALRKLRPGGILVTDNVLWDGEVLRPARDRSTRGIVTFTRRILASRHFHTVLLPVRDGVAVSVRL
jgi:predicted O-methyltransferase YrrM